MADQFKTFDKAPIVGVVHVKHWSFAIREIVIAGLALFLLVLCLIFIALYVNKSTDSVKAGSAQSVMNNGFCASKECLETATNSVDLMNSSVDPCENFYQYACGNYKTEHPYLNRQSGRTVMNDMRDINDDRLLDIIEKPPKRITAWSFEKKMSDFFKSCTADYYRDTLLGRPFLEQVVAKLGGWDLLGSWDEANWDFNTVLKKVQADFMTSAFYSVTVDVDAANYKKRVIVLRPKGIAKWMQYRWYKIGAAERVRNDYKKFIRRTASLLLRDANLANVTNDERDARLDLFVNDTFTVEAKLAEAFDSPQDVDPYLDEHKVTINDLNDETDNVIDWRVQLSYMYRPTSIHGSTKVVTLRRGYYKKVSDIIKSFPDQDRNRMLHNYLIWRILEHYSQDLSWEYIHANREFFVDMHGFQNFLGIRKYCIRQIHFYMRDALGALYIQEHLADKSKQKVKDVTLNLKKALQTELDQTPWMDETTRKYAKDKLDMVTFKIGYPDWMADVNEVDKIYSDFKVNNTNFFGSLLSANQFLRSQDSTSLRQGENRREWIFGIYDTTIAIYWYWNEITATAGILQNPIYDRDAPNYTTFGSLGSILGRYLHHVVDDFGEHYDRTGDQMGNKSWWSQYSINAYKPIHRCVSDVYTNIVQTTTEMNGSPTHVAINHLKYTPAAIAITSGIRLALKSYRDWTQSHGVSEKMLTGVGLTAEQMLFMSYAQAYCSNRGERQRAIFIMRGDPLEELKINMALGQLQEFSDAFQCPAKSKMNHQKKCTYY